MMIITIDDVTIKNVYGIHIEVPGCSYEIEEDERHGCLWIEAANGFLNQRLVADDEDNHGILIGLERDTGQTG